MTENQFLSPGQDNAADQAGSNLSAPSIGHLPSPVQPATPQFYWIPNSPTVSQTAKNPSKLQFFLSILIVVALLSGYAFGRAVGVDGQTGESTGSWGLGSRGSTSTLGKRLDEVSRYLNNEALHVYTDEELDEATRTAIEGLFKAGGDNRAAYFDADEYDLHLSDSSGNFVGIGIQVRQGVDGRPVVQRVFPDSPASEAGVLPGDVVLEIDGVRKNWQVEEAVAEIRREEGKTVTIVWEREKTEIITEMRVRTVHRPIVSTNIIEYESLKVGCIVLEQFTMGCAQEVRTAIQDLESRGVDCYILDLRDNPGGFLYQAIEIASMFVRSGTIVRIEERGKSSTERVSGNHETSKPLVVLINGQSASASELVAVAFQDHGRATIVGEQSYGKGTVQTMRELSFGGAIKYTIANYLSPNGNIVEGVGVRPDIIIDDGNRINDADIIHRLEQGEEIDWAAEGIDISVDYPFPPDIGSPGYQYRPGADISLDAALRYLSDNR